MEIDVIDSIAEDLLCIPPLIGRSIRRKLFKATLASIHEDMSPPHFEIVKTLEEAGSLHITEIGERLQIPGPQMTRLMDRLVSLGFVERQTNPADRRTIDVTLTSRGRRILQEHDQLMRDAIKTTLSCLTNEELTELSASLRKLRDIFSKLREVEAGRGHTTTKLLSVEKR